MELNVNTLPDNPEELHQAFEQIESGEDVLLGTEPAEPVSPKESPQEVASPPDPVTPESPAPATEPETEADGVATRDGKHVIPYAVLRSERERATRAEQMVREAMERVAQLEARLGSAGQSAPQGANIGENARAETEMPALSDEDLVALKEDFPTVHKALMVSIAQQKALESKLQPVEERVYGYVREREQTMAATVQETIDQIPKLAFMQANQPEAFALASQFDAVLREQPAWADKPLSERFARVTAMVESALGEVRLPDEKKAAETPVKNPEDLARAARQLAEKTAQAPSVPTSLSDFPAGQAAAQDEHEAAERLSPLQLAEKFSRLSPDEMDAYFQNL